MKIVLAEDRAGQLQAERSFTTEAVLVGRDPAVCHYFFSQDQWPMVSRRHAEFRLSEGRCLVSDANSRFGTFVNGQKINGPVEVRVGSHVQLGADGPILRVVSIEQTATSKPEAKPAEIDRMATVRDTPSAAVVPPAQAQSPPPKRITPQPSSRPAGPDAHLELIDPQSKQMRRFELSREVVRLGRDPEARCNCR